MVIQCLGTIPLFLTPMVLACLALGVAAVVLVLVVVLPHVVVISGVFAFVVIPIISFRFSRLLGLALLPLAR